MFFDEEPASLPDKSAGSSASDATSDRPSDPDDPLAAVVGPRNSPVKRVNTAKLLVSPNMSIAVEVPPNAFTSKNFTSESNVSVVLTSNTTTGATHLGMTFGYFEQGLFYDPVMYFSNVDDMALQVYSTNVELNMSARCAPGDSQCSRSRRRVGNGGQVPVPLVAMWPLASLSLLTLLLNMLVL